MSTGNGTLAIHPLRVEECSECVPDDAGGLIEQPVKFSIWFGWVAEDGTPMETALDLARQIAADFVAAHASCFLPLASASYDDSRNPSRC